MFTDIVSGGLHPKGEHMNKDYLEQCLSSDSHKKAKLLAIKYFIDPLAKQLPKKFREVTHYPITGYSLQKCCDGAYNSLTNIEIECLSEQILKVYDWDSTEDIPTLDLPSLHYFCLAGFESNLVRVLQIHTRQARLSNEKLNPWITDYQNDISIYGYFHPNKYVLREYDYKEQQNPKYLLNKSKEALMLKYARSVDKFGKYYKKSGGDTFVVELNVDNDVFHNYFINNGYLKVRGTGRSKFKFIKIFPTSDDLSLKDSHPEAYNLKMMNKAYEAGAS